MEENTTSIPAPEPTPPDAIAQWVEDNRDQLEALRNEARQLLRDNFSDDRRSHLDALQTGISGLVI